MVKNSKVVTIFLSNPCSISGKILRTESSWYRFVSKLGLDGDTFNIVSPELKVRSSTFSISLKMEVTANKINHFFYSSFKEFYFKAMAHPISFVKDYFNLVKASECIIFRIPTPGFTLIAILSFLLKKPLVVFISGNIREQSDSYFNSRGLFRLLLAVVLKLRVKLHSVFLKRCKHIFCVSSDVMQLYDLKGGDNVKIIRTPIISITDIDIDGARYFNKESPEIFKIIRVCWIQESKGLEDLLVAVQRVSQHHSISLDIFGTARDKVYGDKIKCLISELNIDKFVNLRGWISNNDLQNIYQDFDLHVMSSKAEGMPRVCLESAAKGLPQLLCPVGGIPDFFKHLHDAYITKDCSSKSIQQGLEWFLNNRELIQSIANNALLGVRDSSIENVADLVNKSIDIRKPRFNIS
ncbi:glycosyltransferase [Gammaproteobacteria bacterium]|jgi:glycosyltransferase involved in cell wall biosynthesis|nr:glycosyltransferase [Gammaproteobacteria bacterium]